MTIPEKEYRIKTQHGHANTVFAIKNDRTGNYNLYRLGNHRTTYQRWSLANGIAFGNLAAIENFFRFHAYEILP